MRHFESKFRAKAPEKPQICIITAEIPSDQICLNLGVHWIYQILCNPSRFSGKSTTVEEMEFHFYRQYA